ncbi:MAG: divergent polysaccharide deacetylase family protein, partial [Pseudomonadota bacterium]|nr:divergent polysaccharide deacetylase family protein [Pseudomonadota bacterium]
LCAALAVLWPQKPQVQPVMPAVVRGPVRQVDIQAAPPPLVTAWVHQAPGPGMSRPTQPLEELIRPLIAAQMEKILPRPEAPRLTPASFPALPDRRTWTGGEPAWIRNALDVAPSADPMIVLIIDDLGVDRKRTRRTLALPGPLTLAFLPYGHNLPEVTAEARRRGHELMVHVPMEPESASEDPGPGALLTSLSDVAVLQRLDQALAAFDGYVGFNNHMGSRFTANRRLMGLVTAEARRRGLLFVDSRTTSRAASRLVSFSPDMPVLDRDVFIDHEISPAFVARQLQTLEQLARRKGFAVGIGHPHDVTLAALSAWLPGLEGKGIRLVPVSTVAKAQMQTPRPGVITAGVP